MTENSKLMRPVIMETSTYMLISNRSCCQEQQVKFHGHELVEDDDI